MMHLPPTFSCCSMLLALLCSTLALAQPPTTTPPPAAATTEVGPPALETNPAVRAALELPRREPADYLLAITALLDLGRPELAKPILDELMKLKLTDAQRAALVAEFGSRSMLQLARARELAPAGAEFAGACMAAAAAAANDPQRIAKLVTQLTDPSAEVRALSRNDLAAIGQVGAAATLEALANQTNPAHREALATAAAQMAPVVNGPLLAMLDTNDPALRAVVARLLHQLEVPQAAPLVAVSSASAERALTAAIDNYTRGTPPFAADEANRVGLWFWDDASKKLALAHFPADEAQTIWLSRLARQRANLRPDNRAYLRHALLLELEIADLLPATHRPAIDPLAAANVGLLDDILDDALAANYARAAVAAADALGRRGDAGVLFTPDAQLSPLATALAHPNRRVRFAALRAIMTLDPAGPYPGSSRVPDALAWFAGSTGERGAIVAMPTLAAATNLAGMLATQDLNAEATNRGRDAVDIARQMPDLEMMFVDMSLIVPDIRQVLYELRTHATTNEIPIALMAAEGRLEAATKLAAEHERVHAVSRPHSDEVLGRIVEQLSRIAGRDVTPPDERAAQAAAASAWLNHLQRNRPFYTVRRTALLDTIEPSLNTTPPAP